MASQSVALLSSLRGDLARVFPDFSQWPSEPSHCETPIQAAVVSLLKDLVRKEKPASNDKPLRKRLVAEATQTFLQANERCRAYSPQLALTAAVLDEVAVILNRLPEVKWEQLFSRSRVGPGSSVGSRGANSALEKLFLNEITSYSPDTVYQYARLVRLFPSMRLAELQRQRRLGAYRAFRIVGSSTFSTVRKTNSTDRGICTEASLDMFFQLGTGEVLNEFLRDEFGFCPTKQPDRNRAHVLRGSMDGSISSVDLSSASDLNSVGFVADAFRHRRDWFELLMQLRASQVKVKGYGDVDMHMISSMGNGYTFPLETLLFSCLVKGLCRVLNVPFKRYNEAGTNFGVFGDDIIVPTCIVEPLLSVLRDVGHVPNPKKTFIAGPFRESCGVDAFLGEDVRAVFHKSWTRGGRYATINGLNFWSARWGIPLPRTVRCLLPKGWKDHLVPLYEDPSAGVYSPVELGRSSYTAWASNPKVTYIYYHQKHGKERVVELKTQFNNPFGVLGCIIDGSIRGGTITRRVNDDDEECDRFRAEALRQTTHWVCRQELRLRGISFDMWTAVAGLNLSI